MTNVEHVEGTCLASSAGAPEWGKQEANAESYAIGILTEALGWRGDDLCLSRPLARRLWSHLTAQPDEDGDRAYRGLRTAPDLHEDFAALESVESDARTPRLSLARWPGAAPFALFLSHDIDQIYDRELFRVLADVNHVRRIVTQGEMGNASQAARRVLRALFRPKRTLWDFETILEIEARHAFRSTFFVLHDRYFARQGARFSYRDREIQEIGRLVLKAGCELGVHGGYYRFNNAALYRDSNQQLAEVFGVEPVGIRNHLLRFSYPETWQAQAEAGFEYDATYGYRSVPGPRSGLAFPFFTYDSARSGPGHLLELPLSVMDTSIFRYLRLSGEQSLEFTWRLVERLAGHGALVTLLWHNNFFNEPEYWDWQMVYEKLLQRLAPLKPWCATGAEINRWWRARAAVRWEEAASDRNEWRWTVEVPQVIEGLVLRVEPAELVSNLTIEHPAATVERREEAWQIKFGKLAAGARCIVRAAR